jgi:hopanoid biosynthesis associated RND transporter like protein HpnN
MTHRPYSILLTRILYGWEKNLLRWPWVIVLLFTLFAGLTLWYTLNHLKVNTNTAEMISTEVPFQKNRIRLESEFPQDINTIVLLVEGRSPEQTAEAVTRLSEALRQDTAHFKSVYLPDEGEFFNRNGLLYLEPEELERLSVRLAAAQPFIGRLTRDYSLRGLFGILTDAFQATGSAADSLEFTPLLEKIRDALNAAREGKPYRLSWQELMSTRTQGLGVTQRFMMVKPALNYSDITPAESVIIALDDLIGTVKQGYLADVVVRKTGEIVLEYEEMQTLSAGVSIAGFASLAAVCLTLWYAYRSLRLMLATFISLTLGLIFSLGFATVAIGQLNLISIGFAVLFIGMGDAYSSHFCLRYRELMLRGQTTDAALRETLTSTGGSLVLCTLTAAIGLYAYLPTHYSGVAELGLIAGTSMFIALGTTFTLLPALMKIMPIRVTVKPHQVRQGIPLILTDWPLRHARPIQVMTLLLTAAALFSLKDVTVDFNPINLRDPETDSVKTYKYLLKSQDTSPLTLSSIASQESELNERKARFEALPTVDKVMTLFDWVPTRQAEKLAILSDLSLIMGSGLTALPPAPVAGQTRWDDVLAFQAALWQRRQARDDGTLAALAQALDDFIRHTETRPPEQRERLLNELEHSLLIHLPTSFNRLVEGLQAEPITLDTLPDDWIARWKSTHGLYRLQIFPKQDLDNLDNLRAFILAAQTVDPDVTDVPVTYYESMQEVVKAFRQAFVIAFIATTALLLLFLRSIRDTMLILLPLVLGSLFTAASIVLVGVPFNFANIIALPLLFGLGVDNGIHMAHRLHYLTANDRNLLGASEAQGVFYGALTTIFSFSSLAFTRHQGTASMGILLAIGLLLTLVCSLVILPAFSTLGTRTIPRQQKQTG